MLNQYLQSLQGILRDRGQRYIEPADLVSYINRARREIAMRAQCVRIKPRIAGSIETIEILNAGTGYVNPSVVISPPDSPSGELPFPAGEWATATAMLLNGQIVNITVVSGGDGYFQPQVSVTDPVGTGAVLKAHTNPISVTQFQQEVYAFADMPLQSFAGVKSIFAVQSVSIIYANYRYSPPFYDFSTYQALIRQYPRQYLYVPTVWTQYGQGDAGTLFMYPIPSQAYQMEWDCYCLPEDLVDDGSVEAIPMPWQEAVPLGAAVYAYEEMQNWNIARYFQDKYDIYCKRYSVYARTGRPTNLYGRW